jgi:hypothetical protein
MTHRQAPSQREQMHSAVPSSLLNPPADRLAYVFYSADGYRWDNQMLAYNQIRGEPIGKLQDSFV